MRDAFRLTSLRGVIGVFALWGLMQSLLRLLTGFRLAGDDPKENIFTQNWALGYLPDNPPLYEWLLHLTQGVFGPTIFSFLFLKYLLLCVSGAFVFLTSRMIFKDEKWAAYSAFALVLLYQIGWNYFQALSHSALAFTMITATIYVCVRLILFRQVKDYAFFGIAIGLGVLSKYNYAGLVIALLCAGIFFKQTRNVFLTPRLLLSAIIVAVITAPHFLWVADHLSAASAMVSDTLGVTRGGHFARAISGIGGVLVAILSFFLPFLLFAAAIFRKGFRHHAPLRGDEERLALHFLALTGLIGAALMFAGVIVLGVPDVSERYAIPFVFPLWFWFMARIRAEDQEPHERLFVFAMAGFAGAALLFRLLTSFIAAPPFCDECMEFVPYEAVIKVVNEKVEGPVTLFVMEENTAGNLRRAFPDAQLVWLNLANHYHPVFEARTCLMVWSEDLAGGPMPPIIRDETNAQNTISVLADWKHPYRDKWHKTEWFITKLPVESVTYRTFCAPRERRRVNAE